MILSALELGKNQQLTPHGFKRFSTSLRELVHLYSGAMIAHRVMWDSAPTDHIKSNFLFKFIIKLDENFTE